MTATRTRFAGAAIGFAAYAWISHELISNAADSALALAVVLGPLALSMLGAVWASGRRWLAGLLALATIAAAAASTQGRGVPPPWLYFAQHAGIHAALCIGFGASLRHTPMITRFASRLHAMTPDLQAYTRRCTVAWTLYFAAITMLSALLFAVAPLAAWSLFANLLTPLSLVAMFVGEHLLRYRLHPEFERIGLVDAARAFSAASGHRR